MVNLLFILSCIILTAATVLYYKLIIKPNQDAKHKERNRVQSWIQADKILADCFKEGQEYDVDFDCGG
jgi:preprotein translocase subunit YajC